jgi:hypothetical protein
MSNGNLRDSRMLLVFRYVPGISRRNQEKLQPRLTAMKIVKLAIAAAAVSLLAAACCPSPKMAPAPAPMTSAK